MHDPCNVCRHSYIDHQIQFYVLRLLFCQYFSAQFMSNEIKMNLIFRIVFSAALLVFGVMFLGRSHAPSVQPTAILESKSSLESPQKIMKFKKPTSTQHG